MDAPPTPSEVPTADPVIFARAFRRGGTVAALDGPQARSWRPGPEDEQIWVHLGLDSPDVGPWLRAQDSLSDAAVEALLSTEDRPRAFQDGEAVVVVIRGPNIGLDADLGEMAAMPLWTDGRRLFSLRRTPAEALEAVLAKIDARLGALSVGDLFVGLLERTVADIARVVSQINEAVDRLETGSTQQPVAEVLTSIADIRRGCLALKRHMAPQREALLDVLAIGPAWLEESHRSRVKQTVERLRADLEDVDVIKESALVLQDDLRNRAAAETSRTSYLLSIVASIFLPLSFITGLLGMDVGGTPGVGSHSAFWIVCAVLAAVLIAEVMIFRKLKWI